MFSMKIMTLNTNSTTEFKILEEESMNSMDSSMENQERDMIQLLCKKLLNHNLIFSMMQVTLFSNSTEYMAQKQKKKVYEI